MKRQTAVRKTPRVSRTWSTFLGGQLDRLARYTSDQGLLEMGTLGSLYVLKPYHTMGGIYVICISAAGVYSYTILQEISTSQCPGSCYAPRLDSGFTLE
jgi:hypothetical protein